MDAAPPDEQLRLIERKVVELFALVAEGIAAATDALLSGDRETAAVLRDREAVIDALYRDAENLVNSRLTSEIAVATDLRFLLSVLRVVPELERSHDLVEHIASRAGGGLCNALSPRARGLVARMGEVGSGMWHDAASAWLGRDVAAAGELAERDDEMDGLHAALSAELATGALLTADAMEMTLVARFYERLGDHAVNVAGRVGFLSGSGWDDERAGG